jgi:ABC-type multidrug transport system fused ATPase/permease subunit
MEGVTILSLQPLMNAGLGEMQSDTWVTILAHIGLDPNKSIIISLFLFGFFGLSSATLHLVSDSMILSLRATIEAQYRQTISQAILHTPWTSFLSLRLGEIGDTVLMDGMHIAHGLSLFLYGVGAVMTMLGLIACTVAISLEMTLYTLGFCLCGYLLFGWTASIARRYADQQKETLTTINELICDVFNNLKYFRAAGYSDAAGKMTHQAFTSYAKAYFRASIHSLTMRFAVEAGGIICILSFFWASIGFGIVNISAAIVFLALFYRTVPRVMAVQQSFYQAAIKLPWYISMQNRLAILNDTNAVAPGAKEPSYNDSLELRKVSYSYPGASSITLKDINLTIANGKFVSLVGPSGGGKSSIIDICLGLISPDEGSVLIDGTDLRALDQHAWRRKVGLVLQESPIFHGTVLDNISWGEESPDRAWAEEVARQSGAWEFISRMPDGLDTEVGEKGAKISGGQKQRLALARAMYGKPSLLILDEPTSSLDAASEQHIMQTLGAIKGKCAILMVAHRLLSVRMSDTILFLEDGLIMESGTWQEFIDDKQSKLYQLYQQQEGNS